MKKEKEDVICRAVDELMQEPARTEMLIPSERGILPVLDSLRKIVDLVKAVVFPGFFDSGKVNDRIRGFYIGVNVERLTHLLSDQIRAIIAYNDEPDPERSAHRMTLQFIEKLPEIKADLYTDVEAIFNNDPAVKHYAEVILCYPAITAMVHYRVAHELLKLGVPVIPRMISEMAHSATGIDIHPGAEIGRYFSIDHGTGVVIGETSIIGDHVTLYQGVTLGAKNFSYDSNGRPVNLPRHPIIGDRVTIYANATVLGRITVGEDSIIGGNVWLTQSVPPKSRILQRKAEDLPLVDGMGI